MKIGFRMMLIAVIVVGLVVGVGIGAFQGSSSKASVAAAAAGRNVARSGAGGSFQQYGGQQSGNRPTMGVVDKVGDQQISLKDPNSSNPVVVRLNDQTSYKKEAAGALSDIKKGERILARGEAGADGTLNATSIQIIAADANGGQSPMGGMGAGGFQGGANGQQGQGNRQGGQGGNQNTSFEMGTVNSIDNNTISITPQGSRSAGNGFQGAATKVAVSDKTTITKTVDGSLQDVKEGAFVVVTGPTGADGVMVASTVQILPSNASRTMRRGQQ